MLGAMLGDIIGSVHEHDKASHERKSKDFSLFGEGCCYTDDSVCTAAVADILLHDKDPSATMQEWCRRHLKIKGGYGCSFAKWIQRKNPKPYNSFGNGAGMRVSPAAFLNRGDLSAALAASDRVTKITHNHSEGIKGARATTHAIWLAFNGKSPADIRAVIAAEYRYDLSSSVDEIRPGYRYNEKCQETVPQAIVCALESVDYEDAVRNAVSLGGDADTLAAIAGAIAEAIHGIPAEIRRCGEACLPLDIKEIMAEMYAR